ncbi:zinc metallopeptidase [Bacteroidota bacterium]
MIGIIIVLMVLSFVVSTILKRKIRKYSQIGIRSELAGSEVAHKMLYDNGIHDVKVTCTQGQLTDHYNPGQKTVNLSEHVYHGRSVASAAVAAHECGHALQHEEGYAPLKLRTALVPLQNMSGRVLNFIVILAIFGGFILYEAFPMSQVLILIILCYSVLTLFSFITLPVEFNASRQAMGWLTTRGVIDNNESKMAQDALKWAAMTYVVSAIASLITLLYYVMILVGGSRD